MPVVGLSNPEIMRSNVVFPQPDGPSRVRNSPDATLSVTPATAVMLPNRFVTSTSSTIASISPIPCRGTAFYRIDGSVRNADRRHGNVQQSTREAQILDLPRPVS